MKEDLDWEKRVVPAAVPIKKLVDDGRQTPWCLYVGYRLTSLSGNGLNETCENESVDENNDIQVKEDLEEKELATRLLSIEKVIFL